MIISVVAAKIWYLKNMRFLLGHPVYFSFPFHSFIFHTVSSLEVCGRATSELRSGTPVTSPPGKFVKFNYLLRLEDFQHGGFDLEL